VNEWLHIWNWKYLNIFIPKTSRRSGEAIARKNKLICFQNYEFHLAKAKQKNYGTPQNSARLKDNLFHKQYWNLDDDDKKSTWIFLNELNKRRTIVSLKTTFLGKYGTSHMISQHHIKIVSDHIHIQGVPGGMCQTSGECSLGQTIPINPKHLYPKLNSYGDIGQRKVWTSLVSA